MPAFSVHKELIELKVSQLDSLKSRLQTTKTRMPVHRLAGIVYREEGVTGFYRGLWIPLVTISFVRESPPPPTALYNVQTTIQVQLRSLYIVAQKNIVAKTTILQVIELGMLLLRVVSAVPCLGH